MKKILIGLLALGSVSAFAETPEYCVSLQGVGPYGDAMDHQVQCSSGYETKVATNTKYKPGKPDPTIVEEMAKRDLVPAQVFLGNFEFDAMPLPAVLFVAKSEAAQKKAYGIAFVDPRTGWFGSGEGRAAYALSLGRTFYNLFEIKLSGSADKILAQAKSHISGKFKEVGYEYVSSVKAGRGEILIFAR